MGVVVVISNVNFSSFSLPFFFVGPVPMPLVLCVGSVSVCLAWPEFFLGYMYPGLVKK